MAKDKLLDRIAREVKWAVVCITGPSILEIGRKKDKGKGTDRPDKPISQQDRTGTRRDR